MAKEKKPAIKIIATIIIVTLFSLLVCGNAAIFYFLSVISLKYNVDMMSYLISLVLLNIIVYTGIAIKTIERI